MVRDDAIKGYGSKDGDSGCGCMIPKVSAFTLKEN
jgi:hypothetical protein